MPGEWFWNPVGHWVIFWSGFGSCLTEFAIVGTVWSHLNCHARGCPWLGRHQVPGTPHKTCRRHAPHLPNRAPSAAEIAADHREAQNAQR